MMGIVVSETFWAYKKYNKIISNIQLVLILQLSHWCTVQQTSNVPMCLSKKVEFLCQVWINKKWRCHVCRECEQNCYEIASDSSTHVQKSTTKPPCMIKLIGCCIQPPRSSRKFCFTLCKHDINKQWWNAIANVRKEHDFQAAGHN